MTGKWTQLGLFIERTQIAPKKVVAKTKPKRKRKSKKSSKPAKGLLDLIGYPDLDDDISDLYR